MSVVGPTADAPQSAVTPARQHPFGPLKHTAPAPPPQQPKLLDRLREALRTRHYSRRTEQCYCHWVKRFIQRAVKEAVHKAGIIKHVGCHTFRHSGVYPALVRDNAPAGKRL